MLPNRIGSRPSQAPILGFHFKAGPYVRAAIEIGSTAHPGWARKYKMIYPEPTSSF